MIYSHCISKSESKFVLEYIRLLAKAISQLHFLLSKDMPGLIWIQAV